MELVGTSRSRRRHRCPAGAHRRHPDLKNAFHDQARVHGRTPDSENRLRQQVRKPNELRAADTEEITQPRSEVEALVGALHQSMTENRLPRRQLADHTPSSAHCPRRPGSGTAPAPMPPDLP
ncbi:hypothetical protein PV396_04690 [Streptomyces sp. ME02-8801-2C]|uniref:hypothetical protein n=1 Tax=Streptomyces sp. ME02-8801-2C TaxID=3028680 RepID=UPI0029AFB143|nr:hypothetical protein [Streptomyces sp. ME02-8801-2C]MDX3451251.1 hypothetical protein [Streptomyces sp. ME02-8801-2C]